MKFKEIIKKTYKQKKQEFLKFCEKMYEKKTVLSIFDTKTIQDKKNKEAIKLAIQMAFKAGRMTALPQIQEKNNDVMNSSANFYAPGFNQIGVNYLSEGYMGKGQLNTKLMWNKYSDNFIFTLFPYYIGRMLKTCSLMRGVVEYPVQDAFSEYQVIQTETNFNEQEMKSFKKMYNRNHFIVMDAIIKAKTFGGSAIIFTGDKNPLDKPLKYKKGDKMKLVACERWALTNVEMEYRIEDNKNFLENEQIFNEYNETFNVGKNSSDYVFYSGVKVHKSRVYPIVNNVNTINVLYKNVLCGWSFSTFESLRVALFEFLQGQEALAELLVRQKYDVLKVEGLRDKVNLAGAELLSDMLNLLEVQKTMQETSDAILLDKTDDYTTIQNDFDIAKMYEGLIMILTVNTSIPKSRFLGGDKGGNFNSASVNESERAYNQYLQVQKQYFGDIFEQVAMFTSICTFGENFNFEIFFEKEQVASLSEKRETASSLVNQLATLKTAGILSLSQTLKILNQEKIFKINLEEEIEEGLEQDVIENQDNINQDK